MKIAICSMSAFVGGAEVAAERLGRGLESRGHEVLMLLGDGGDVRARLEGAGLRCRVSPMCFTDKRHWFRYLRARNGIRRILREEGVELLHSNDLQTLQIVSDAARGLGIPRVCHHRWFFVGSEADWLLKFGAERHLFVSRALQDELYRRSERLRGVPGAVVYDGLPLEPLPTAVDRRAAREKLGLALGKVLVTFAGQIIERKGVAELIRAWMRLPEGVRDRAELLIIGEDSGHAGAYRVATQELASELGCAARFVGFQRDVRSWLVASDISVVPSHEEPLGNAVLEAMTAALPVIGGDVGGIPEMIDRDATGLLVPPRDAERLAKGLETLITDAALRERMGAAGRARCEALFSLEAHTESVLREYAAVLGDLAVGTRAGAGLL